MWSSRVVAFFIAVALCGHARAGVVLNEIFYHAPDDVEDLQYIELHNAGDKAVDLGGWKLTKGVLYTFPAGTKIDAGGYLVVCKSLERFKKVYGFDAAGPFDGTLSHRGEVVELTDAAGKKVESVKYGTRAPWPAAADGYGCSLERICPTAKADSPDNWAPSPFPAGGPKPVGTPGKKNASYAPRLPPVISQVKFAPTHVLPNQTVNVEAEVSTADAIKSVELRYRLAGVGAETQEKAIPMTAAKGRYTARIPPQKQAPIIRFRIRAVDGKGVERFYPGENDLRPALSVYAHPKFTPNKIPAGLIFNVGQGAGTRPLFNFNFGRPGPPPAPARGGSAFVYVDAKTGEPELFDFVNVTPRNGGRKVRFHKDRPFRGMTTFNLIYEGVDRFVLAEPLAYEVYRKAGNAAPRTDFLRTWVDGKPLGFQLLIEQPNKAFLAYNKLTPGGNMYKCVWYGNDLISKHEKKTRVHAGHDDLVKLVAELKATKGDEQWAVIKKHFDVEQVINYFAVNMVLSHWDG